MNYTIGGKDMTNFFTFNQDNLFVLQNYCEQYIKDVLITDFSIGISPFLLSTIKNISMQIFADIVTILNKYSGDYIHNEMQAYELSPFYYKRNKYNLNIMGNGIKIKVFLGIFREIAKINFNMAEANFKEYHDRYFLESIDRPLYRIEIFKIVYGFTFDDLLRPKNQGILKNDRLGLNEHIKNEILGDNKIATIYRYFLDYLYTQIHSTTIRENVCYPNDINTGNLVIQYPCDSSCPYRVLNIDYDHIVIDTHKHMINDVTWQFVSRIYDKNNLPDSDTYQFVIDYRNENDMIEEIEKIKIEFCKTTKFNYNTKKERFNFPISIELLNGNEDLYEYVNNRIREFNEK
jgi:hypothetical protein